MVSQWFQLNEPPEADSPPSQFLERSRKDTSSASGLIRLRGYRNRESERDEERSRGGRRCKCKAPGPGVELISRVGNKVSGREPFTRCTGTTEPFSLGIPISRLLQRGEAGAPLADALTVGCDSYLPLNHAEDAAETSDKKRCGCSQG